ncbi:uncharacterized protein PHACADRAFT_107234 [Phanerochaete carnosa HHB-10118-sp]|uniref:Uncharacterized protein n=1 Tax=Phanerochaete carnosa (strain HHB-10118-sp) TaxID=650164 RepID=K5VDK8_PHACS|nr:uncharacterized protein PHACADRAFT_107234 [Phanerochaete carnosa HHB-10118-sp]EKM49213.1 hypothetical protein PHACADRAFT_107234 [Phanerochaete carnosa HHB-10118-sp]
MDVEELDVDSVPKSETCCMQRILSLQVDLLGEKSVIQTYPEFISHSCYFILRYHCELNFIEMSWG